MKKVALALAMAAAVFQLAPAAAYSKSLLPKKAHNLSAGEVRKIYSNKTWKWENGGAFFGQGAKFFAFSGEGKNLSIAMGRWMVTKGGRLCFDATWSSAAYSSARSMTCFNHAAYKGQIYQAKGLSGKWYVIKSAAPKSGDMINQIVGGNTIACRLIQSGATLKGHVSSKQMRNLSRLKTASGASCSET